MTKQEILEYAEENYELPESGMPEEYFQDKEFVKSLLKIDTYFMNSIPLDVQKQLIIENVRYANYVDIDRIFKDEESIRECIEGNPDLLLRIKNCTVESEYLKEQYSGYIRGDLKKC